VTQLFDHYHGAVITDDETLRHHYESEPKCGIIGNHGNRFGFLREQGYIKEHYGQEG